jgi:hypothetical protein
MRRRRPDLIVPIRDRRQHKRILTLKNAAWVLGAVVVLFIGLTLQSEFRRSTPGQFGGLMQRQAPAPVTPSPRVEPIREGAAVAEQPSADPMLLAPAAREQEYLGVNRPAPRASATQPAALPLQPVQVDAAPHQPMLGHSSGHLAIVGDGKGVTIVQTTTAPREKLSGGIFRPQ